MYNVQVSMYLKDNIHYLKNKQVNISEEYRILWK